MSRCLSEDALTRAHVELASAAERAHLAGCVACSDRYRRLHRELEMVTSMLRDSPEPHPRLPASPRRFMPAALGLSAAALALLIWVEVAVWRAATPPATMQPQEVAAILSDVSASLFSVSGDPSTGGTSSATAPEDTLPSVEAMARALDSTLTGDEP